MSGYAVVSDVHANARALRAVLADIKQRGIADIYFIGDAVGYGPDPNEVVESLVSQCRLMLAGNHDWGTVGLASTESFNENARLALAWTRSVLSDNNLDILKNAPLKAELAEKGITLVHATPFEPEQWHYLFKLSDAEINFRYVQTDLCFLGHSHKSSIIERNPSGEFRIHKHEVKKLSGCRYFINAGSVGQPRDGDPRACYAVVDDDTIELVRVEYDIRGTQKRMEELHLPRPLIERLLLGL